MLVFLLLFINVRLARPEWEIPEEFYPPKELFDRIGGYSSFIRFGDITLGQIQRAVKVFLSSSDETKYSSLVLLDEIQRVPSLENCLLPFSSSKRCYRKQQYQKVIMYDKTQDDECLFFNSTFVNLNVPDDEGFCNNEFDFVPKIGTNITIFCKTICPSSVNASQYLEQQLLTSQVCACEKCSSVIRHKSSSNSTNHFQVNIALDSSSLYVTTNITDVKAISSNDDHCPSIVSTTIDYFKANNNASTTARFWLRRGRFHCPSEVTCPWEIFYVFYQDDPVFKPSYLFAAKVVILGIHVAIAEKAITSYTNKLW